MACNIIPKDQDELLALADTFLGGLAANEAGIGIKNNTLSRMAAVIATMRTAEAEFRTALDDWWRARSAGKAADAALVEFLGVCRSVLAARLGERWGTGWEATGFPNRSTAVPKTQPARLELAASLHAYFTTHPEMEVASLGATEAAAQSHRDAFRAARAEENRLGGVREEKLQARDAAYLALRKRAQWMFSELRCLVPEDDPRWLAFGFKLPAAEETPEAVSALKLNSGGRGAVQVKWFRARRAKYYRVFAQVIGVDAGMSARARVTDLECLLNDLPRGATVAVQIIAANGAREAPPSPVREWVVA